MHFKKILEEPGRKSTKIWLDLGSDFPNRLMKLGLHDNSIEMF